MGGIYMIARILSRVLRWLHKNHTFVQVNDGYVVKVSELMDTSLPKPRRKTNVVIGGDNEVLPIITYRCEDDFKYTKGFQKRLIN